MEHHIIGFDSQQARALRGEVLASQIAEGIFTEDEAEAMQQPGATTTSWLSASSKRPGHTLILVDGEVVTAAADLFGGDVRSECVLENFAVLRASQGKGYSRELWRLVQEDARDNSMDTIIIFALLADQQAVDYWRHLLACEPTENGSMTCRDRHFGAVGWRYHLK